MPDHKSDTDLQRGFSQINRESGGLLRIEVIRDHDRAPILFAAMGGDRQAMARLSAILESSAEIKKIARKAPAICLCCPRRVRDPNATIALLIPAADEPSVCIGSPLCEKCSAGNLKEILARVCSGYIAIWPSLRTVAVTHPSGGTA